MAERNNTTEKNNTTAPDSAETKASRRTRHTWIGDADEVKPGARERQVTRDTYSAVLGKTTKLVERDKKPYKGFITDEEVKHAEAAAEIDRRSREESRAAREKMAQTRIYSGFDSTVEDKPETDAGDKTASDVKKPVRRRRTFNITIEDKGKFKRLIALACVFAVLLAFEISYFALKARTASLPGDAAKMQSDTEAMLEENTQLQGEIDKLGDYDQLTESRDAWKKIRDQLAE